ncbi:MAG: SDR family NAD(P)-dependent oxidoreductase [Geminicoccaceae bacterium]
MEGRLKDRVALVTGGGRGIGASIARRLDAEGAKVWIAEIDEAEGKAIAGSLTNGRYQHVDITKDDSVAALATTIEEDAGRLDILVNNAAVLDVIPMQDLTATHCAKILETNLNGAVRVTLAMVGLLRKSSVGGRILNIASVNGLRGTPDNIPYSIAKGGIVNLTRCLAVDLGADGIRVNAIAPGFIDTRMSVMPDGSHEHKSVWFNDIYIKYGRIPLRRGGKPEDIAGPAFFFCSDDCGYVSGQVLAVDGGMLATF